MENKTINKKQQKNDKNKVSYYHGTSSSVVNNILQNGLIPALQGVAHKWAVQNGWSIQQQNSNRPASTYLTTNRDLAEIYAKRAAEVRCDEPVVVIVNISKTVIVIQDEDDQYGVRIEQTVPDVCIQVIA